MKSLAVCAIAAVALLCGVSRAEGLKVANNFAKMSDTGYDLSVLPINRIGSGFKLLAGDPLEVRFGMEASLANTTQFGYAAERMVTRAYFLDAVGLYPVSRDLSLLGRIGRFQSQLDLGVAVPGSLGLKAGLGLQYEFSKRVTLRGDWERLHMDAVALHPERDRYSLGVNYRF